MVNPYILGIDLGGSSIKAVTLASDGQLSSRRTVEFTPGEGMAWANRIRDLVAEIASEQQCVASAIGLAAPGLVPPNGRAVAYMPGRLQGLEGLDWSAYLGAERAIPVLNDAHAALLGEVALGAAVGLRNVIMLTLGTGVGGAAMVDGKLITGHIGRAGHLGHICLDLDGPPDITRTPGSLEWMIGNCSIRGRSQGRFSSTHELVAAHLAGDAEATGLWLRSVRALGCAIASFVNILDPEAVVIGGGIARAGEALLQPLRAVLEEVEWRPGGHTVQLRLAQLGEHAGAVGAAFEAGGKVGKPWQCSGRV
jgi:glucokinase